MADKYKIRPPPTFSSASSLLMIAEWLDNIKHRFITQQGGCIDQETERMVLKGAPRPSQKAYSSLNIASATLHRQAKRSTGEPVRVELLVSEFSQTRRLPVCSGGRINPEIIEALCIIGMRSTLGYCLIHQAVFEISMDRMMALLPSSQPGANEEVKELEMGEGEKGIGKLVWKVYAFRG